jgi:toxin-antitoxin system PIN domain toxin
VSVCLLDVNVLVALTWPNHEHHHPARRWFERRQRRRWATAAVTQLGFLRIVTNPVIVRPSLTPPIAHRLLSEMTGTEGHVYWESGPAVTDARFPVQVVAGHRQVTDAYLLALAHFHAGRVATLDRGLASMARAARLADRVELIHAALSGP